jgi:hypothetical protein
MSKGGLSKVVKDVKVTLSKHSPEILTGIGIAGMVTTTVLAVRATPKALILIEQKKDELEVDKLTPVETVKTTWKCYLPSAVIGGASVFCLIGASSVNLRRNAALATAYALSESTLKDYQKKVVEEIGEKKEKSVRDSIAKDKIKENPASKNEIIITGTGETRCYDIMCKRYFKSNIETLRKIENDLNRRMRSENYISLNEFYNEIGLDDVGAGHELGWNIDKGYIELEFSSHLDDEGIPCLVVGFNNPPTYGFRW